MSKKRPERTERRARERAARKLVQDRERLAAMSPGGSPERPIAVDSAAVVEVRVQSLTCPQCEGTYRILDHRSPASGSRAVDVSCALCGTRRTLWFKLVTSEPN